MRFSLRTEPMLGRAVRRYCELHDLSLSVAMRRALKRLVSTQAVS